jgi:hypothetical protein
MPGTATKGNCPGPAGQPCLAPSGGVSTYDAAAARGCAPPGGAPPGSTPRYRIAPTTTAPPDGACIDSAALPPGALLRVALLPRDGSSVVGVASPAGAPCTEDAAGSEDASRPDNPAPLEPADRPEDALSPGDTSLAELLVNTASDVGSLGFL